MFQYRLFKTWPVLNQILISKKKTCFYFQIKCSQYWPESTDEEYYGDFYISKSKSEERHFAFYVIRKFTMSNSEVKNINNKNQNTGLLQ